MKGRIHSTESFGTVDGPGVRFVVFLQGCPMRCAYCHNPDTWDPKGGTPTEASEIIEQYIRNESFYQGGGITVTGGEPLMQIDFVESVLKKLKENGIHTALDTTGYAKWEVLQRTMPYTDLYLYDLKHMDSEKHRKVVQVPNELILENAQELAAHGKKLQIRIPVIPLFNDDPENIRKTAEFCRKLGDAVTMVQLLPYHNFGVMKYLRISDGPAFEATPPSDEYMEKLKDMIGGYGLRATIH
jgi:pyruvate formate lyase activating enzyme